MKKILDISKISYMLKKFKKISYMFGSKRILKFPFIYLSGIFSILKFISLTYIEMTMSTRIYR